MDDSLEPIVPPLFRSKKAHSVMGILDILEAVLAGPDSQQQSSSRSGSTAKRRRLPALDSLPDSGGRSIADAMKSVVQIIALRRGGFGGMSSAWTGSGTIVHPQGIILTNCHVANPGAMGMQSPKADRIAIAITERSDRAPAISYFADIVNYEPSLDLAVLRIIADARGRQVDELRLPSVPIGNSDQLELGHKLAILGYPGIGGETVTFTSGNVSGFTSERGVNDHRAWIKTDATISGGNSGGTAINESGQLIGVPTQAAAGTGVTPVDARPVLDTNQDGRVDRRDTPMAIGGFINGLRPVNLAIPLLEDAGMRIDQDRSATVREALPRHQPQRSSGFDWNRRIEKPEFQHLVFSRELTDDGRPINPSEHIQQPADAVFATFEFDGMRNGTPWSTVWMSNGKIIIEQNEQWDDGEQGTKSVKISNRKGVPAGEYHLLLGINGKVELEGKMRVSERIDDRDSEIRGQIVDNRTGQGINNALVIVLNPRASLRHFLETRSEDDVQTSTETDSQGNFTLPDQLPKGESYSLVVAARGYEPITVEGALRVGPTAPEHADIGQIEMQRD